IVLVGSSTITGTQTFAAERFGATGGVDQNFGVHGIAAYGLTGIDTATSAALQSDGKIIIGGNSAALPGEAGQALALERLTDVGTLDTSFGVTGETRFTSPTEHFSLSG